MQCILCVQVNSIVHFYFRLGKRILSRWFPKKNSLPHGCLGHTHLLFYFRSCFPSAWEEHRASALRNTGDLLALAVEVSLCPLSVVHYTYNLTNPTVNLRTLLFYTTMKYMKLAGADAVTINSPFMNFIL